MHNGQAQPPKSGEPKKAPANAGRFFNKISSEAAITPRGVNAPLWKKKSSCSRFKPN